MSQETKDFLIVALILALGGWGFLAWSKNNPQLPSLTDSEPVSEYSETGEQVTKDKIICKIEPELKAFMKCDKKTHAIQFFVDESKENLLFEIEAEALLSECENNQCKNVEIPKTFKRFTNENPRTISLFIPNYATKQEILEVIRKGFKTDPPNMGDSIRVHFLSSPDQSFEAEYTFLGFKANIINYYRNKNKVIHLIPEAKKGKQDTGFVLADQTSFYSFADFEAKLTAFLDDVPRPSVMENIPFAQLLQNLGKITENDKTQVVAFVLDETIQFPKARSYELNDQGYQWFYTYQQRYNNDVGRNNRTCTQQGYKNCRLEHFWEELFSEYYVRHTEAKLFPILNYRFPSDKIEILILDPRIDATKKSDLEAEKEKIFGTIQELLRDRITR